MNLEIINPITYPEWDEMLSNHEDASFFHTSHWARVLNESYGYTPLYFSNIYDGRINNLIPIMEVNSLLTGKRGVSLPFTDYCCPVMSGDISFHDAFNAVIDYGKNAGWKYTELRGTGDYMNGNKSSSIYYGHILKLTADEKQIFLHFKDSNRRNIRKAIKEGVEVDICNSVESVKEFYRLNCLTRKHHGLPPQPFIFFQNIFDHVISKGQGHVVLAKYKDTFIAGAVYFHFGNKAIYKYGASDSGYQHLRANNLVMWEAIKYYCKRGCAELSFGRTDMDHDGLRQFKNGWGTLESIITYYKYNITTNEFKKDKIKVSGVHNTVFSRMPMPLLKTAGSLLYKHIG